MTTQIESYWKNKPEEYKENIESWMNWFDKCESVHEFQKTGMIDFMHKIFSNSYLYDITGDPGNKIALEIGVGGGRLTNISCKIFKHVYGIDIHNSLNKTEDILRKLGNENFTLFKYSDTIKDEILQLLDKKVDFVYSFIVFQHFQNWKTAQNYIDIIDKVLSKDGCGKIFFGINNLDNRDYFERDLYEDQGITLGVSPKFIKSIFEERFNVIEIGMTTKKMWNKVPSDQFFITFKRK